MDSNGSRSRRKISRVNYAETSNNDEELILLEEEMELATTAAAKSMTANSSSASSKLKRKTSKESSPAADNFPLNWQPKLPPGEKLSAVMDFEGAIVDNGVLTLQDGETLAPEGR